MSTHFLVSHGCAAALSRCRDDAGLCPRRGDRVVIRTARGEELGEVMCDTSEGPAATFTEATLVRLAGAVDLGRAAAASQRARALADDVQRIIDDWHLPLMALDADMPLDAASAIVHVLRWEACTLTPLLDELRRRHAVPVYLLDRSGPAEAEHDHGCGSCGSGGCGEGGCSTGSCGTGNCSRGAASAAELTAYFAALREQMQAAEARTPLL